jgi:DNA-binding transcriptional LysR family regulator
MRQTIAINTTPTVLAAALASGGLSVLPDFLVAEHLRTKRLVHILPSWALPSGGIHAVYPATRFRPPKVTAFVAMLSRQTKRSS